MNLFISYSRIDKAVVQALHAALVARGRELWVDWEGIPPSADWMREIEAAIEAADAVVFVLSPASLASTVCGQELAHAQALNKRVLPVVVQEPGGVAVPPGLARLNWIFLRATDAFDAGIDRLLEAVDTDLDWVRAHTRLLVRANEWQAAPANTGLLLRGPELRRAEQWLTTGPSKTPPPTEAQAQFVLASRRHATRQRGMLFAAGGVALVVAAVLGTVALLESRQSDRQEALATVRRLAAAAERMRDLTPPERAVIAPSERSLQLAAEAVRRLSVLDERSFEADLALRRALQQALRHQRTIETEWHGDMAADMVVDDPGGLGVVLKGSGQVARWRNAETGWVTAAEPGLRTAEAALSPDGRWSASVQSNHGSPPFVLEVHEAGRDGPVLHVELPTSSARLAVGAGGIVAVSLSAGSGSGRETRILQPGSAEPVAVLPYLWSPTFSGDGQWLAGVSDERAVVRRVAVLRAGFPDAPRLLAPKEVGNVRFSSDSQRLLVSHRSRVDLLTRFAAPDWTEVANGFSDLPLAAGPMARQWVADDEVRSLVHLVHADSGTHLGRLLRWDGARVAVSPGGKVLAVERGHAIDVWHLPAPGSAAAEIEVGDAALAFAFGSDGRSIAALHRPAGAAQARLTRWRLDAPAERPTTLDIGPWAATAAFSADGRFVALAADGGVRVVDATTGAERLNAVLPAAAKPARPVLSPQGDALAVLGKDQSVATWETASGRQTMAPVRAAKAGVDLAVADGGAPLTLIDLARTSRIGANHEVITWASPAAAPASAALGRLASGFAAQPCGLSPDGRLLAINRAGSLVVRDVRRGVDVAVVDETARPPQCTVSADGAWLATTGDDATLRIWDLRARQEAARMELLDPARAIVFDAAARQVAVLDDAGTVRVWPLDLPALLAQACGRMRFGMSRDDWERFFPGEAYRPTCPGLEPAPDPKR